MSTYYEILEKAKCKMTTDYNAYIIGKTISAFRYGLYPKTRNEDKKNLKTGLSF